MKIVCSLRSYNNQRHPGESRDPYEINLIHYGSRIAEKFRDFSLSGMTAICCLFFLAGSCLIFPGHAKSAQISAEYLMHVCSNGRGGREKVEGGDITCQAYIAGVMDYHALLSSLGTSPSVDFCIPSNVELGDLQDIVVDYLHRNPQHTGFIASPAVALALYEAFPCK
jgi:hypothetical protein